jgi:CubicO group peptidase (beta-lactamase class C family)
MYNRMMKTELLAVLLAIIPSMSTAMGTHPAPRQAVEAELRKFVEEGGAPGLAAALITPEGVTYFSSGVVAGEPGRKLDENTQFQVASISKLLTSVAMADMVREGRLSLDDPADKYLPKEYRLPILGGKAITLRTLATHTSGLPSSDRSDKERKNAVRYGWDYALKYLSKVKLGSVPGAKFNYSNSGMALLGHVLELRDGRPYEKLVSDRVLHPQGMDSTWVTRPPGAQKPVVDFEIGIFAPAGGYSSNAVDLAKFVQGALGRAPLPLMKSFELTFPGQGNDTGGRPLHLGWHEDGGPARLSHTGLSHAYLGIDLEKKVGVVILCTDQTLLINPLGSAALAALGGGRAEFPRPRKTVKMPAATLEKYTGVYALDNSGGKVTVTSDSARGILLLSFDGRVKFPMWAEKEDFYYCKEWKCDMEFPALVNGQAPSVRLTMDNWTGDYTRTASGR